MQLPDRYRWHFAEDARHLLNAVMCRARRRRNSSYSAAESRALSLRSSWTGRSVSFRRIPDRLQHSHQQTLPAEAPEQMTECQNAPYRVIGRPDLLVPMIVTLGALVTFYTMYHTHPVGRHFIQVCTTSPCNICGAEDVVKAFLEQTGCGELGLTSPDGKYTVIEVECLGACGFATPIMVNDDFIDSVSVQRVPEILKQYS